MKADKVRELDEAALRQQAREADEQIFRLKFQMSMGQTDGVKKYRQLKKDRARLFTVLTERGLKPAANPAPVEKSKKGKK